MLKENGDLPGAEDDYRRGVQMDDPYAPDAALRLGELLAGKGDHAQAEEAYKNAIGSHDMTVVPTATLRLAESFEARGKDTDARRAYVEAISSSPDIALQAGGELVHLLKSLTMTDGHSGSSG